MLLKCEKGQHLTAAEMTAIEYINQNIETVGELSIVEIADRAFVSPATISRAIRKCGIKKLPNMRQKIAMRDIAREHYAVDSIFEKTYSECMGTIQNLDISSVLEVTSYIRKSRRIMILASGYTRYVALEFESQLQWQGYDVCVISDTSIMRCLDQFIRPDDCIIVFSVANTTTELAIAANIAKEAGAKVVTCCCKQGTTLEKISDITLIGCFKPVVLPNHFEVGSLLSLQIIYWTIVEALIANV